MPRFAWRRAFAVGRVRIDDQRTRHPVGAVPVETRTRVDGRCGKDRGVTDVASPPSSISTQHALDALYAQSVRRHAVIFLASGAYLGYAPIASGTFGTLAGVALYPVFDALRGLSLPLYVVTFLALVAAAIAIAGEAEQIFGEKDSGKITIDEVTGYIAATLFVRPSLAVVATSFVLFRLFDVVKIWPASYFDREVHGGPGVVIDDVISGLYANLALRALVWLGGFTV